MSIARPHATEASGDVTVDLLTRIGHAKRKGQSILFPPGFGAIVFNDTNVDFGASKSGAGVDALLERPLAATRLDDVGRYLPFGLGSPFGGERVSVRIGSFDTDPGCLAAVDEGGGSEGNILEDGGAIVRIR